MRARASQPRGAPLAGFDLMLSWIVYHAAEGLSNATTPGAITKARKDESAKRGNGFWLSEFLDFAIESFPDLVLS
jgi:hypothetical protein